MSIEPDSVPRALKQSRKTRLELPTTKCVFDIDADFDPEQKIVGVIYDLCYPPIEGAVVGFEVVGLILLFEVESVELLIRSKENETNTDVATKILLNSNTDPWSFVYVIKLKVYGKESSIESFEYD